MGLFNECVYEFYSTSVSDRFIYSMDFVYFIVRNDTIHLLWCKYQNYSLVMCRSFFFLEIVELKTGCKIETYFIWCSNESKYANILYNLHFMRFKIIPFEQRQYFTSKMNYFFYCQIECDLFFFHSICW